MAISPQLARYSEQIRKKHGLDFDVLSDTGHDWMRKLGLVFQFPDDLREVYLKFPIDLSRFNGDDSWELPLPTRLIIRPDGSIAHIDAHPDYTERPEPTETLALLRALT